MKIKTILMVLTALLGVLFTSANASAKTKTPFKKYIQKKSYETRLKNAASSYALASADDCPMRNTTFARKRYEILQQPVFKTKRLHPFEGIWIEKVSVLICGKAQSLDVTVISDKDGKTPKFEVSLSKQEPAYKPKKPEHFYGDYN